MSLQYLIELGAAGYCNWDPSVSVAESLAAFREVQRSYRSPNPTKMGAVTNLADDVSPAEDDGNAFCWQQYGHVVVGYADSMDVRALGPSHKAVYLLWLTSDLTGTDHVKSSSKKFYCLRFDDVRAFIDADPSQDLLIVQGPSAELYLLSLLSGERHSALAPHMEGPLTIPNLREIEAVSGEWLLVSTFVGEAGGEQDNVLQLLYHWPTGVKRKVC